MVNRAVRNQVREPQLEAMRWAFFTVLLAGPLCFGATEPWSILLIQLGVVAVLIGWALLCRKNTSIQIDLPTVSLFLFGALGLAQLLTRHTVYSYATQQELLKIASYFLFFVLSRQLLQTRDARQQIAALLASFGGILALFGIVQHFQSNGKIYWIRETATQSFFGPYANKNHYAGLLEMLIPFALFGAIDTRRPNAKRVLSTFFAAVMIASVVLCGSRTGVVVAIFELVLFAGFRRFAVRGPRVLVPLVVGLLLGFVFVSWIAGDALVHQSAVLLDPVNDASLANRSQIARDSFELVKEHPVCGWGLGTFPVVYPQVASWYTDSLVNAAHDDYLQLLVETGVVGLGFVLVFVCLVFVRGLKRLQSAPTSTTAAALLGCAGLLLHSLTDFNLHVPANAAMFFSLCGMVCAAEGTTTQHASALLLHAQTTARACVRRWPLPGRVKAQPAATSTKSRFRWPTT